MTRSNAPSMRPDVPVTYTPDVDVRTNAGGQRNGTPPHNTQALTPRGALAFLPAGNGPQGIRRPVATAPAKSPILELTRSVQQHVNVATSGDIRGTGAFIGRMPAGPARTAHQDVFYRALERSVSQIGSLATPQARSNAYLDAASAFNLPEGSLPAKYKARLLNAFADRIGLLSDPLQAGTFDALCTITGDLNSSELQIEPLRALAEQIKLPAVYGQARQAIDRLAVITLTLPEKYHFDIASRLTLAIESTDNPNKDTVCAHVHDAIPTDTMFQY